MTKKKGQEFDEMDIANHVTHEVFMKFLRPDFPCSLVSAPLLEEIVVPYN